MFRNNPSSLLHLFCIILIVWLQGMYPALGYFILPLYVVLMRAISTDLGISGFLTRISGEMFKIGADLYNMTPFTNYFKIRYFNNGWAELHNLGVNL